MDAETFTSPFFLLVKMSWTLLPMHLYKVNYSYKIEIWITRRLFNLNMFVYVFYETKHACIRCDCELFYLLPFHMVWLKFLLLATLSVISLPPFLIGILFPTPMCALTIWGVSKTSVATLDWITEQKFSSYTTDGDYW